MQQRKRWQFYLIAVVIVLTIYNILPTVFYYSKPLKKPVNETQATQIASSALKRVNVLERDSVAWLDSFCKMLKISPASIKAKSDNPSQIVALFNSQADAKRFRRFMPRAGALIPFVPAQLFLSQDDNLSKQVLIQRQIPMQFNQSMEKSLFKFSYKSDSSGKVSPLYKDLVFDRAVQIGLAIGSQSNEAVLLKTIESSQISYLASNAVFTLCQDLVDFVDVFGENSLISSRYFASFTQEEFSSKSSAVGAFVSSIDQIRDMIKKEKIQLKQKKSASKSEFTSDEDRRNVSLLEKKESLLIRARSIVQKHRSQFAKGANPWTYSSLSELLNSSFNNNIQQITVGNRSTFIDKIIVDWKNDKIVFTLKKDIEDYKKRLKGAKKDRFDQLIINEIASINRKTDEKISSQVDRFVINLNQLTNSKSFLVLELDQIAKSQSGLIKNILDSEWNPSHMELKRDVFPIYDYETYKNLPLTKQKLCLVVYAPMLHSSVAKDGMKANAIYVMAKGIDRIIKKYQAVPDSEGARLFAKDFEELRNVLSRNGFLGYSASSLFANSDFKNDFIFERSDYYNTIIAATRENFVVNGTKKYGVLEFTDLEQRIITTNKIETAIHEDLLKWKDDYNSARVSIDPNKKYDVPSPVRNAFFSNLALSARKYFRGDERKIIHWGLDLSGGKTVQIELRDQNNKIVSNEADLKQGSNELYNRVNKMGVSEVSIRTVGSNIVLDFPGAQNLSAAELVKASTMFFHIVNEKFSPENKALAENANRFLQEVWNEAVVTNRKDVDSINRIAWNHLYGTSLDSDTVQPRSEAAKALYDNGLKLASVSNTTISSAFNDVISKIAVFRGDDSSKWQGQVHPLIIVFNNYALEGSNLINIRPGYDPSKGNFLSFEVGSSYTNKEGVKISPRDDMFLWTSQFSKEKIEGTVLEKYSRNKGWRMAVVLNDTVISAPVLESALRDHAMISGSFSQREVNQLSADLKAGSLSFTPKILSEKNVSPELGQMERTKGIVATFVALILVIIAMSIYYRFSGIVASVAVVFNLLIMWAALQNLQATLTLAGLAGIILTVGMAVDANVLVFERIREEFLSTGRIVSSIQTGYKKAFSAIFDSNITTIIAALILLNFDAGPIKGFAITLIIGIVSSMFTALFVTKYFFTKWSQNPNHKKLNMRNWISSTNFDFLKNSKYMFYVSGLIIVVGGYLLFAQRHVVFGMDFTGGFSLNVELNEKSGSNYRNIVEKALIKNGATAKDFQIRELNPTNNLRIMLGSSMEEKGAPFYGLPFETTKKNVSYAYENNPRISWVIDSLAKNGITVKKQNLENLDKSWTAMSGQMSDSMRNNAAIGLFLALVSILIYLTFRFEFKFAVSAMFCIVHDVLISVTLIAILYFFGVPIQIDLHTIAAIMTIIGYSLNDTIIVFDRIREDLKSMRKATFIEIVNHSLNVTLSRTTITSGTTFIVLLALVALGGSTIFSFALVMIIGVVFGTLSSIFIASPMMLLFHKIELKKENQVPIRES
jgi:SecD/SecF fusion protein